jgi:hypothetical protein
MMYVPPLLISFLVSCGGVRPSSQESDGTSVSASGHFQLHKSSQGMFSMNGLQDPTNGFEDRFVDQSNTKGADKLEPAHRLERVENETEPITLESETEPVINSPIKDSELLSERGSLPEPLLDVPHGSRLESTDVLDGTEHLGNDENETLTQNVVGIEGPVEKIQVDAAKQQTKVEERPKQDGLAPDLEPAGLMPGQNVQLFRQSDGKVVEMEESANKLQEHLTNVGSNFGSVEQKLEAYGESIGELSKQFNDLSESAHGIPGEVKTEFQDKEKIRLCSFENAKREIKGEPQIDCNTL